MKAMILAAGIGSRLRPLTDTRPKALVEIGGRAMLDIVIERLVRHDFNEIIVNVHHFPEQIVQHLKKYNQSDIHIEISDESDMLLDTGGAILKARPFLEGDEPFLVHNVDILSTVNPREMVREHNDRDSLATLAVSQRQSSRYFLFDDINRLWGWENLATDEKKLCPGATHRLNRLAFSGIHVISPEIFQLMTFAGRFSIIPAYLQLAASHPIHGFQHDPATWLDLGKPENIQKAEIFLDKGR